MIYTVAGQSCIEERDGALVTLTPSDVLSTEPGVEHGHGGSGPSTVIQIAVHFGEDRWLEEMTDREYGRQRSVVLKTVREEKHQ